MFRLLSSTQLMADTSWRQEKRSTRFLNCPTGCSTYTGAATMTASALRISSSTIWKSSLITQLLSFPLSSAMEQAPQPIQRSIVSLCVLINLISASGYASFAPYSASFVKMSLFAFFLPNDKPNIFICFSILSVSFLCSAYDYTGISCFLLSIFCFFCWGKIDLPDFSSVYNMQGGHICIFFFDLSAEYLCKRVYRFFNPHQVSWPRSRHLTLPDYFVYT